MSSATASARTTPSDRQNIALLKRYGITPTIALCQTLDDYIRRMHRLRWWGVVGAIFLGVVGWVSVSTHTPAYGPARVFAGYLLGSAVGELTMPSRHPAGPHRTASLGTRGALAFVPRWGRVVPFLTLVPCLASPLLLLFGHSTSPAQISSLDGPRTITPHWFSTVALVTTAGTAAFGLLAWWLTLRRISGRSLPTEGTDATRLDVLTRLLSARAASGAASALGLVLLGGLGLLGENAMRTLSCTSTSHCHLMRTGLERADNVSSLGALLLLIGICVFAISRWPRVDKTLRGYAAEPSP